MILVDFDAPEGVTREALDALVARWGQQVRFALADEDVSVGMVRGHALPLPSEHVLAALALASATLSEKP